MIVVEGIAAGAMLTMIGSAMLPEAAHLSTPNMAGFSTLVGFVSADTKPTKVEKPAILGVDKCAASGSIAEPIMVNIAPAAIPSTTIMAEWGMDSPT